MAVAGWLTGGPSEADEGLRSTHVVHGQGRRVMAPAHDSKTQRLRLFVGVGDVSVLLLVGVR